MKKVILVDDEPLALERLSNLIKHYVGYEIIGEYGSAAEAIKSAGELLPDIIITDICMAKVDGLTMIEKMQETWGKQVGFIIVSGYGQFDYAQKALNLGVAAYLLKPVIEKELKDALDKVCNQQDIQKRKEQSAVGSVVITKEYMRENIAQAEEIFAAVFAYNTEKLHSLLVNFAETFSESENRIEALNRLCWIIFALLDSRVGNTEHDFQNLWYNSVGNGFEEFDQDMQEKLEDSLEQCMLRIMEIHGYHKNQVVSYMKLYIRQNYTKDISLSWFAERLFINTAYLGQKFKKETGESVSSFLHKIRVEKAKELAEKTSMTWREIADAVGYKSYLGFFEHFTKLEGRSPSDYRI